MDLANSDKRIVITRYSDFLKITLRKRIKYGLIYIAEPIRRDNVEKLAKNIEKGSPLYMLVYVFI